jgi:hypothetical protein
MHEIAISLLIYIQKNERQIIHYLTIDDIGYVIAGYPLHVWSFPCFCGWIAPQLVCCFSGIGL